MYRKHGIKLTSAVSCILVVCLATNAAQAVDLFSDGFESGDFATGGWTTSGSPTVSNKADYAGTYGAKIPSTASIEKALSTVGYTDIHVKYYRKTKGLDSGEYLYAEWYDGSGWNPLEST
ncbi:MAG: hypothetical protein ACYTBJ_26635, partial [Planctomycetota bacterium]